MVHKGVAPSDIVRVCVAHLDCSADISQGCALLVDGRDKSGEIRAPGML